MYCMTYPSGNLNNISHVSFFGSHFGGVQGQVTNEPTAEHIDGEAPQF